jgi:hypothetical protein
MRLCLPSPSRGGSPAEVGLARLRRGIDGRNRKHPISAGGGVGWNESTCASELWLISAPVPYAPIKQTLKENSGASFASSNLSVFIFAARFRSATSSSTSHAIRRGSSLKLMAVNTTLQTACRQTSNAMPICGSADFACCDFGTTTLWEILRVLCTKFQTLCPQPPTPTPPRKGEGLSTPVSAARTLRQCERDL